MDLSSILEGIKTIDPVWIAAVAVVVSEVLPQTNKVKANSTCQLIFNLVKVIIEGLKKNSQPIPEKKV